MDFFLSRKGKFQKIFKKFPSKELKIRKIEFNLHPTEGFRFFNALFYISKTTYKVRIKLKNSIYFLSVFFDFFRP
jgi:hypothetical protein